jgi:ABC-type antimicrobial peptide transport system permease subunit
VPYGQEPTYNLFFTLRGGPDPAAHAHAALEILQRIDPTVAASEVRTLHEARDERLAGIRLGASMMAAFALLALLLAAVGSYGVAANLVSQRTHEIGVRMALGARGVDVIGLVLRRGLLLTAIGSAIGIAAGVALVKVVDSALVGLVAGGAGVIALVAAIVVGCVRHIPSRAAQVVPDMDTPVGPVVRATRSQAGGIIADTDTVRRR